LVCALRLTVFRSERTEGSARDASLLVVLPSVNLSWLSTSRCGPTHSGAPKVAEQLMALRLSAVWALMVAFEDPLPVPFEGASQGCRLLSDASRQPEQKAINAIA
jgi:hypothetical protein